MPMLDPETKGLIKLGLDQKRAIEEGRLDANEAYNVPPSLRTARSGRGGGADPIGTVALGVGMVGVVALYVLAAALAGVTIRKILLVDVGGLQLYVPVGLSMACLSIGTAFWVYRDIRRRWTFAVAQVIVATAAGVAGILAAPDYTTKGVAIAGAAVAVADGIEKLAKALRSSKA